MVKILYLVAGANGSGKTTFARELLTKEKACFLNADEIMLKRNITPLKAGKEYFKKLKLSIKTGKSVVLETTLSGNNHQKIIESFMSAGYKIHLFYVFLDNAEACIDRVALRVAKGGHNVPQADIIRRYERSKKGLSALKNKVDFWVLVYNGAREYEMVASGKGSHIEIVNDALYNFFMNGAKNG
ncbi:putative ABC-type ATPase [Candidatus Termititenax aidoneus]|uniref:ABC-type ATPase n=1 Tax=Termititenax aidoneus TaxID=2218524 RepID=A0A388TBB3_TERA1|nr:putative ABC-type ATPase [Candidatus Termititenax aidoneus]